MQDSPESVGGNIYLRRRKVVVQRVSIVKFGVDSRGKAGIPVLRRNSRMNLERDEI